MSAILFATALSGLLASKLFLVFSVDNFVIRYPLSVLCSYFVFFICIKLWIVYISPRNQNKSKLTDWLEIPTPSSGGSNIPSCHGGGGEFSGAVASTSFDVDSAVVSDVPISTVSEGASGIVDGVGDVVGETAGAIGEEGGILGIVVLIVLATLVATILGGAIYVISEAPIILSEAAFEGLLAATLIRKTRIINDENWIGSVFKTTWKPFAITLVITFFAATILHMYFPEATKLSDILKLR